MTTFNTQTITLQMVNPVSELGTASGFESVATFGPAFAAVSKVGRLTGYVELRNLVQVISACTLDSNPRFSRRGEVTNEIQETIKLTPELLPFKSKGILMAVSYVAPRDRNRIAITITDPETEGILDGGHNALAVGLHLLEYIGVGASELRAIKTWSDLKDEWAKHETELDELRRNPADNTALLPMEILFPANPADEACVTYFNEHLLEICAARNNNVQLKDTTTANQAGLLDALKQALGPELAAKVQWKTNGEGTIPVQDVTALAWLALGRLELPADDSGAPFTAVSGRSAYASKGQAFKRFSKLMAADSVSRSSDGDYQREVYNPQVLSALAILPDVLRLWDFVQCQLGPSYNNIGGSFGKITAVRKMNSSSKKAKRSDYFDTPMDYNVPSGFMMPLVFAAAWLIERDKTTGELRWRDGLDPVEFYAKHMDELVLGMKELFEAFNFDPQKVGKENATYSNLEQAVKSMYLADKYGADE